MVSTKPFKCLCKGMNLLHMFIEDISVVKECGLKPYNICTNVTLHIHIYTHTHIPCPLLINPAKNRF